MRSYKFYMHHAGEAASAPQELVADSDADAANLAAVIANACGDVCTSFEVWEGQRLLINATVSGGCPTAAQLNRRAQMIVLDRELALRDSESQIAESRSLIRNIDALFAHIDSGFRHT
jgi:hypothetical protein